MSGILSNISEWFRGAVPRRVQPRPGSPNGISTFDVSAIVAFFGWLLIEVLLLAILRIGDSSRSAAA